MVSRAWLDRYLPIFVACGIPILIALGRIELMLGCALACILVMAILYSRAERPLLPVALSIGGVVAIVSAMLVLWLRKGH